MKSSFLKTAALSCLLISICGCGGEDYGDPVTVTGTVTLKSQPLTGADITFHAMEGLPAKLRSRIGKTDAQGKYELKDVYPAEYKVMVQKYDYSIEEAPADGSASPDDPLKDYGSESKLRETVSAEKTQFDFDL